MFQKPLLVSKSHFGQIMFSGFVVFFFALTTFFGSSCTNTKAEQDYPIKPVPFTSVKLTDDFWAPRIITNHKVTIPIAIQKCRETGRIENFIIAAKLKEGSFCSLYPFDDSDVFKILEGASYSLQTFPDPELEKTIDTLIYYIGLAQEPDGYLYTNRTIDSTKMHEWAGKKRWEKDPELSHELYNIGHLYEAAVAHFQATGKRTLLDIAIKSADLVVHDFLEGGLKYYPGHQVIEMGLVKLYRVTGNKKYLETAKYFLDIREGGDEYNQAHKKVIEQDQITGHAVRATYMYSGMADVAALTQDENYILATDRIWEDMISGKFYITGGIGSGGDNEGFDDPFYLPNMTAYCETCASIGNVFWNYRLFLLHGDSKYYDVLEKTLYNALLSGVSLSGDRFFYPNVLESRGQHERSAWFGCACCPSNVSRFLPSVPGYVYATDKETIFTNLYVENEANIDFQDQKIQVIQKTDYPWNGDVEITINPAQTCSFSLALRIPGWVSNKSIPGELYHFIPGESTSFELTLNGEPAGYSLQNGYAFIRNNWKSGDKVVLHLPMTVKKIKANEKVKADLGKIALQRGPMVYCLEWPDHKDGRVLNLVLNQNEPIEPQFMPELLNGVTVLHGKARNAVETENGINAEQTVPFTAIPYHVWANRGPGEMMVWIPEAPEFARPIPLPTIAGSSKINSSKDKPSLRSINDRDLPENSNDHSVLYHHWWPQKDTTVWVEYEFEKSSKVTETSVYWFDDGPDGGCRIPESWMVFYKKGGKWVPVKVNGVYPNLKDTLNTVQFEAATTSALRLEIKLQKEYSTGLYEWIIK